MRPSDWVGRTGGAGVLRVARRGAIAIVLGHLTCIFINIIRLMCRICSPLLAYAKYPAGCRLGDAHWDYRSIDQATQLAPRGG